MKTESVWELLNHGPNLWLISQGTSFTIRCNLFGLQLCHAKAADIQSENLKNWIKQISPCWSSQALTETSLLQTRCWLVKPVEKPLNRCQTAGTCLFSVLPQIWKHTAKKLPCRKILKHFKWRCSIQRSSSRDVNYPTTEASQAAWKEISGWHFGSTEVGSCFATGYNGARI